MINADFSTQRFPRPNKASITSSAHLSLARFEADPGANGRQAVDSVVSMIDVTKTLDNGFADTNDAAGQVDYRHNSETTARVSDRRSLTFDPGTGETSSFGQEYHYLSGPDSGGGSREMHVRRSFWRDENGKEHYLESQSNGTTTQVVLDRRNGTVAVLSEEF